MIRHIVMWKFREGTGEDQERFLSGLKGLYGVIPGIRNLSVQRSVKKDGDNDAVLIADFDSEEALAAYLKDPRHLAVSSICKAIRVSRSSIDVAV